MSPATILIVEDDPEMRAMLVRGLREEGLHAEGVATGEQLLTRVAERPADLFVIDIGLPDTDGRDLCQALRAHGITAPVLFLTARDAVTDRLSGFSAGGDDYLTKPFAFAELVARLEALLRRAGVEPVVTAGALTLDPRSHAVACSGVEARLTPTEFRLLARLAAAPGKVVRRQALMEAAWPHGAIVRPNTLDAYLTRLRRKLSGLPGAPTIDTAHGVGYCLR
jgi:two-component system, OmpR family, response regulator